jgi:hypothetical protein
MKLKLIAVVISLFAFSAANAGYYVGADVGYNKVDDRLGKMMNFWDVNAGYKFCPYFALETGFNKYPSDVAATSIDLVGKFIAPIYTSGFDMFVKLGGTVKHFDSGITDVTPYFGVGAGYAITQDLEAIVQTSTDNNLSKDLKFEKVTAGLVYSF